MYTRILYVAVDGNEFDDQYKCQEYEKEILALRQKLCDIKFFDNKKSRLATPFVFQERYEEIMDRLYVDCTYIEITDHLDHETQNYIREIWGWSIPSTKGFYKYDWDKMEWIRET